MNRYDVGLDENLFEHGLALVVRDVIVIDPLLGQLVSQLARPRILRVLQAHHHQVLMTKNGQVPLVSNGILVQSCTWRGGQPLGKSHCWPESVRDVGTPPSYLVAGLVVR